MLFFVTVQASDHTSDKTLLHSSQRTWLLVEYANPSNYFTWADSFSDRIPSFVFSYFEYVFEALILVSVVFGLVLPNLFVIYSKGSDPLGEDSVKELNSILDSSKRSTVTANPGTVGVSYLSPSNVILTSIQRFNAASACSGDDAAAAGTSMHV